MKQSTLGRINIVAMGAFAAFSLGLRNGVGIVGFIAAAFWALAYTRLAVQKESLPQANPEPLVKSKEKAIK